MTTVLAATPVLGLRDAVSAYLDTDFSAFDADGLIAVLRDTETELRRLAAGQHALIAELESQYVAHQVGARDTATVVRHVLRVTPKEAKARVMAARDLGPRRDLIGAPLQPIFSAVAAAQAEGAISGEHARVIISLINRLPGEVQVLHGEAVESLMVEHARQFDPIELAKLGMQHEAHLNPDGTLNDDEDHQRRRDVRLTARPDGSGDLTGCLTPAALAALQSVLDPLAAPKPAADGTRDERTAGQRMHDGLEQMALRLLRSDLPDTGGAPVTIGVTMTLEQLETRCGYATTGHGGQISIPEALRLAAEAEIVPIVLNAAGGVLAYGRTCRYATSHQRRALAARDGGCSFPGCDTPAAWTQAHHIIAWIDDGLTDINNLTLLCGYHHRHFEQLGWTCHITNGLPEWVPPPWIDPHQQPRRNVRVHHLDHELDLDLDRDHDRDHEPDPRLTGRAGAPELSDPRARLHTTSPTPRRQLW